jgi:hypothetical protein
MIFLKEKKIKFNNWPMRVRFITAGPNYFGGKNKLERKNLKLTKEINQVQIQTQFALSNYIFDNKMEPMREPNCIFSIFPIKQFGFLRSVLGISIFQFIDI